MAPDHLSEVFDLVEVRGVVSGGFAVTGPWRAYAEVRGMMKFFALRSGRCTLDADGLDAPIELAAGDVAITNGREWLCAEGGEGDGPRRDVEPDGEFAAADLGNFDLATHDLLVGGRIELRGAGRELLTQALPPVAHVRGDAAPNVPIVLDRLFAEGSRGGVGTAFAMRQYGQLLLLEAVRAYVDQAELPPGWLRVLTDERLRPAVSLMHAEPGEAWGLDALAKAASMSRTTFAERFRAVAGVPPLAYLQRWRMLLAQRALRDGDVRVRSLATELGYGSESAFSTAFKREVGLSPLRYRRQIREGAL